MDFRRDPRLRPLPARPRALVLATALLLSACTSAPPNLGKVDRDAVARYRAAGYVPGTQATIRTQIVGATVSEPPWTFRLTRPDDRGTHPLIVYLPTLGEPQDAPNRWIDVWARAGYAVLALQPLEEDARVWETPAARSGDFERIARARFSDDLMADRIARLAQRLNRIRQRSLQGDPDLAGLDWSRVALAGADLGAYTVQTLAVGAFARPASSEAAAGVVAGWPIAPLAFLAISPYAGRPGPAPDAPAPGHAPVLMISAREDVDPYGVVTDMAVRHRAFDRLGQGENYYFELGSATHRWLGGVPPAPSSAPAPGPRPAAANRTEGGDRRSRGGDARRGSAGDSMAPESDDDDAGADKNAHGAAAREKKAADLARERDRALTHDALSGVSFEAVSVAFFDAYLRQNPQARSWLADAAGKWLQDGDRLKRH
jgi:hypothetical protein